MEATLPKSVASNGSGKRQLTKQQNRKLILDAARRVFAELGFGAATVRDIIRSTPLASGTFYNYFKSKEEVFQAIRDEVALAIRPRLHEERMKAKTVEEFITCSFRTFFEYVADDSVNFQSIRLNASRLHANAPEVIAGFEELRVDIDTAIAKGLFPPVDADYLLAAIVGVAFEVAERMVRREPHDPAAAADFATALFLGGLRKLPYIATPNGEAGNAQN
jgi:AcrR family transcriptional regulator